MASASASAGLLPASLPIGRSSNRSLSSCRILTGPNPFPPFSSLTASGGLASSPAAIRMGGGPRTFPGGVSKWQWKRMQAKKSKQLLKARLCRERQLYEMRKRAELKAAISELERPWEAAERAPVLFSASADEQVKALADRFQRPCGFDMWSERDGPRLFRSPDDLPSVRFFPKGALHSVRPYGVAGGEKYDDWIARGRGRRGRALPGWSSTKSVAPVGEEENRGDAYCSDSELVVAGRRRGRGGRGGSKVSGRSYSERAVGGSRMGREEIAGGFGKRRGSDAELAVADWRKGGRVEMAGGRDDRDYGYGGRISLRPTTGLGLEGGGDVRRRAAKWSEGRNEGFRVDRGRRGLK